MHVWQLTVSSAYDESVPDVLYRHCVVCGAVQMMHSSKSEWEVFCSRPAGREDCLATLVSRIRRIWRDGEARDLMDGVEELRKRISSGAQQSEEDGA